MIRNNYMQVNTIDNPTNRYYLRNEWRHTHKEEFNRYMDDPTNTKSYSDVKLPQHTVNKLNMRAPANFPNALQV